MLSYGIAGVTVTGDGGTTGGSGGEIGEPIGAADGGIMVVTLGWRTIKKYNTIRIFLHGHNTPKYKFIQ